MYFKLNSNSKWHKVRDVSLDRDRSLCGIELYSTDVFVIKSNIQPVSNCSPLYCKSCSDLEGRTRL